MLVDDKYIIRQAIANIRLEGLVIPDIIVTHLNNDVVDTEELLKLVKSL